MDFKERDIIGEGKHHRVYLRDSEHVIKVPQKDTNISYNQAQKSVSFFQEELGEYIPETSILYGNKEFPYQVVQKRVNGILLGDYIRHNGVSQKIGESLLCFTKKALHILDGKIVGFDIIGTPPSPEFKGRWEGCTNIIVSPDETLSFVDCVVPSRAIGRSYIINRLLQSFWYQRRKKHYISLLQDLEQKLQKK